MPDRVVRIQAEVVWEVVEDKEAGLWVGVCRDLGLNADGKTFRAFQRCADEATDFLFSDLCAEGDLEAFLAARGWKIEEEDLAFAENEKLTFDFPVKMEPIPA